jgi:hypothetical protein
MGNAGRRNDGGFGGMEVGDVRWGAFSSGRKSGGERREGETTQVDAGRRGRTVGKSTSHALALSLWRRTGVGGGGVVERKWWLVWAERVSVKRKWVSSCGRSRRLFDLPESRPSPGSCEKVGLRPQPMERRDAEREAAEKYAILI